MKRAAFAVAVFALTALAGQPPQKEAKPFTPRPFGEKLQLTPGGQRFGAYAGLTRVVVGDDQVVDAKTTEGGLLLVATSVGRTNVLLWFKDGKREHVEVEVGVTETPLEEQGETTLESHFALVITIPGVKRVALGNPSVADVSTLGNNQFLVLARYPGHTTLLAWKMDGTIIQWRLTVTPPAAVPGVTYLNLSVDEPREVAIPPGAELSLDTSLVLAAEKSDGGLTLRGLKNGDTTLRVIDAVGRESVFQLRIRGEKPAPVATPPVKKP